MRNLQGYRLPEWSHMAAGDSGRFTDALAPRVLQGGCGACGTAYIR